MDYTQDLQRALRLADIADEIGLKYFRSIDLKVESKPDSSPVTQGDKEIEAALSNIVAQDFGDSYIGEEGTRTGTSQRRWLVDPIDGTKNFLRGMPIWGSLISLKDETGVVVACVSAPALGRRWWATKEDGAFTRDADGTERPITVSAIEDIKDSFVLHGTFKNMDDMGLDSEKVFKLLKSAWRHRGPGDFFGYMLVAEGASDVFVEVPSNLWDIEAPRFIVEQAGGSVWARPDEMETVQQQRLTVTTNGKLEPEILNFLELTA